MTNAELLEFALATAEAAGQAILPHFRAALDVEDKGGAKGYDPVTVADHAAEAIVHRFRGRREFDRHVVWRSTGAAEEDIEQFERELAPVGEPVQPTAPAAALTPAQHQEDHERAADDSERAQRSPAGVVAIDDQRQQHDAGRVGDRDLREQLQHRRTGQPQ